MYCTVQKTLQFPVMQAYKRWVIIIIKKSFSCQSQAYKRWAIIIITKLEISVTLMIAAFMTESSFLCSQHLPSDSERVC